MEDRERNLLILLGILGAGIGIWYYLLPMYNHYVSLEDKIKSNVEDIRDAQRKASRLKSLLSNLEDTKRKLKAAKQKLPEKGRFNELMSQLEEQAREAGIQDRQIITFNRGNSNQIKDGAVREMIIKANFVGIKMSQLTDMLWRFDNMVRMVDIKSFKNFNLKQVETDQGYVFNLNLNLSVYILEAEDLSEKINNGDVAGGEA